MNVRTSLTSEFRANNLIIEKTNTYTIEQIKIDSIVTIGNTYLVSNGNNSTNYMPTSTTESRPTEITIIFLLISLLILLPPMLEFWGDGGNPWYTPYLVWAVIISLTYFLQRLLRTHAV